jgi:hypothetical protein
VTFEFTVDPDELPAGAAPEDVVVYRYHGGVWTTHEPEHLGNGTYRVTAPGFSVWAVGTPSETPPPTTAGEPSFSLSAFDLTSTSAAPGETVAVEGTVTNTGEAVGTHSVNLSVDGTTWRVASVTLEPGETATVRFVVSFDEPGDYDLAVNDGDVGTVDVTGDRTASSGGEPETPEFEGAGLPVTSVLVALVFGLIFSALGVYYRYYVG